MMVRQYEDVIHAIKSVPREGGLFCFFAFDDRQSHQAVLDFLTDSRHWVDSLSSNAGIRTLFFGSKWSEIVDPPGWMFREAPGSKEESRFLGTLEKITKYINPTLELAKHFGIPPRSLPGLIIFDALPDSVPVHSLYVPLNLDWFLQGTQSSESALAEIYSCIGEAAVGAGLFSFIESVSSRLSGSPDRFEKIFSSIERSLSRFGKPSKRLYGIGKNLSDVIDEVEDSLYPKTRENEKFAPFVSRNEAQETRIFVSYAREDEKLADFMYRRFLEAGFRPWIDRRNILPGEKWDVAISKAMHDADFLLVILSSSSVAKRGYVQKEFREALKLWEQRLDSDIYLIPVRFGEIVVPDVFQGFQWVDFKGGEGWSKIMQALKEGIRRRKEVPS
jgi:hypothetical protein